MKKHPKHREGFTLTELLVVISIIIVLAVLIVAIVGRAREGARKSASSNNLRQIGVAVASFVAENNGYLPASRSSMGVYWPQIVWPYAESLDIYMLPMSPKRPMDSKMNDGEGYFPMTDNAAMNPQKQPIRWNYVINGGAPKLPFAELADDGKPLPGIGNGLSRPYNQITDPARTLMMAEGTSWWLNAEAKPGSSRIRTWSNGTANILWCDGSLQLLNPKTDLRPEHFWAKK